VAFSITHRNGAMQADPPFEAIDALLDELDGIDDEHPDVAVSHDSGWAISAFASGRLIYENVEDLDQLPRQIVVDRRGARDLLRVLAAGDLTRLEAAAWQPYRPGDIGAH
jgi:hypothetical protein